MHLPSNLLMNICQIQGQFFLQTLVTSFNSAYLSTLKPMFFSPPYVKGLPANTHEDPCKVRDPAFSSASEAFGSFSRNIPKSLYEVSCDVVSHLLQFATQIRLRPPVWGIIEQGRNGPMFRGSRGHPLFYEISLTIANLDWCIFVPVRRKRTDVGPEYTHYWGVTNHSPSSTLRPIG